MSVLKARIEIAMPVEALLAADVDWPEGAGEPPTISLFEGGDPAKSVVEIFAPGPVEAGELAEFLGRLGDATGSAIPPPLFEAVAERDWVSESQRLRQPIKAGRFTICEAHQRADLGAAENVIVIEAGLAFGTGGHGSTKGCLLALDALAEKIAPANALDLGSGSGVLAIAMAQLWDIPIVASDIDPVATTTAGANIAVNKAARASAVTADGVNHPAIIAGAPFGLITANILARPLIDLAPGIAGISAGGGTLIISGITREQAAAVQTAYEDAGFLPQSPVTLGDWSTLVFLRKA